MTTKPDLPPPADTASSFSDAPGAAIAGNPVAEARLDCLLAQLAGLYAGVAVPSQALESLEQRFERESRQLGEQDLEWLAAAGPLFPRSDLKEKN